MNTQVEIEPQFSPITPIEPYEPEEEAKESLAVEPVTKPKAVGGGLAASLRPENMEKLVK